MTDFESLILYPWDFGIIAYTWKNQRPLESWSKIDDHLPTALWDRWASCMGALLEYSSHYTIITESLSLLLCLSLHTHTHTPLHTQKETETEKT